MISVVLTTYNRAPLLPRAIDSVRSQTCEDWQLVVVDDGSTDETGVFLDGLDDPRIGVGRHVANRGVAAAKNTGFDHIRGDWFTTFDSDDEMKPEALAVLLDSAARTGADAVACNCVDADSGAMTGFGVTADRWLTPRDAATMSGDHWGITRTGLLGGMRFDERLPGSHALWLKINVRARRYYVHRALLVVHTEGADRVTDALGAADLRKNVAAYACLGEDRDYLRALKIADARRYRRTVGRVWAARVLRPVLRVRPAGERPARPDDERSGPA
jgi:glycosyltransferase involved in cell wall biosynthesis